VSSPVDWRRNLVALWFAEFTAIFGFSFAFPFLSIFISQDLGVHNARDLDLWTAAAGSVSGLAMAVASPIWGILGDRFGRKPMLIRSMLGGAITVGLIFFVQTPLQLVILRFIQGATSGTVAAATSLVAAETPQFVQYLQQNFPNNISTRILTSAPIGSSPVTGFVTAGRICKTLTVHTKTRTESRTTYSEISCTSQ